MLLVVIIAGIPFKNFAYTLLNQQNMSRDSLVEYFSIFFIIVSILSFLIAGFFHFFTVKKLLKPINVISAAAKDTADGKIAQIVNIDHPRELAELIGNYNKLTQTLSSAQLHREQMLEDIAHELRTPLTNINGYLEALQGEVIKGTPEIYGSLLEESRRLTRIVELITELNAWKKNVYFLEKPFTQVKIDEVLQESFSSFHLKLTEQFEQLTFKKDEAIIFGHKDGLKQVFSNIIQNIIDYNLGDKLKMEGIRDQDTYHIHFYHTGQFIESDNKDLLFERFFRLEKSRNKKVDGAGLGLAIAKSIIETHNGTIGLTTDGHNHCFWIKLPIITNV